MRAAHLGVESRPRSLQSLIIDWLGNSRHLWMWDCLSLEAKLVDHGFQEVRRAEFNDCEDPAFLAVEDLGRFAGACALQAKTPALTEG